MMMGVVVGQEGVGVGEEVVLPSEEGDPAKKKKQNKYMTQIRIH